MRVLIDATSLLLRSAGVKSYTWHWLRALQSLPSAGTFEAFPMLGDAAMALDHSKSVLGPIGTWARLGGVFATNVLGSAALDAWCRGYDVFHCSNMVRVPTTRARLTATVHDLTSFLMPELHTPGNIQADRYFAERILKRANRLIAVSENTRRDAIRVLGIDPGRIDVIHSGVDERFFTARPLVRARPYVLFLGTIEPRKNLDALLDCWHQVPRGVRDGFDFLVAGPLGWKSEDTLTRLQQNMEHVRYLGYVPESDIPSLTAGAAAFAYVSLYEGFGFPVAQAMAAGVPVITSNTSCLPEIAGAGALLVDPKSPAEIGSALTRLLESVELRRKLGAEGAAHAARYRWSECARASFEFFERARSSS